VISEQAGQTEALLQQLTRDEKVALLAGADAWRVAPIERLGIRELVMSDGPSGVRGDTATSGRSVSFPAGVALAATWDPALVTDVGRALGRQARAMGVHVLLGPTVNLHRHPLAGRNFECYSEDPELTSQMACAYIAGVQSAGVACCVKHLVANESEYQRHTISSEVDEAVLRELYLTPFDEAVRAGVWSTMASYNRLNGTYTSEHPWLLTELLRGDWGFDGVVVSDWWATHSTVEALTAGLDIEMPGPPRYRGQALLDALDKGLVGEADLDRAAFRVLRLIARTAPAGDEQGASDSRPEAAEVTRLIRTAGARGMVLLRNRGVLPLDAGGLRTVAVIGPLADAEQFQGGGSTQVNPPHVSGILASLRDALGPEVTVAFERGCVLPDWPSPLGPPLLRTPAGEDGAVLEYHLAADPDAPALKVDHPRTLQLNWIGELVPGHANGELLVRARGVVHPAEDGPHQITVTGTGTVRVLLDGIELVEPGPAAASPAEDSGRRLVADLSAGRPAEFVVEFSPAATPHARVQVSVAPPGGPDLLDRAVTAAGAADAVLVVAGSPAGWETEGRDRPGMDLPGTQNELIAAVCAANPRTVVALNTGAPVAMPWADQAGAILQLWFPGQEIGTALADVLTGVVNPSGKLPTTFPASIDRLPVSPYYPGADGRVEYGERFSVGYRRTPRSGGAEPEEAPRFPFGYGLSYSSFELGSPEVRPVANPEEPGWEVTVPVTNTSGPAGREVVQVYVTSEAPDRPVLELKGFVAVEAAPGQTVTARIAIARRRLRTWGPGGWEFPIGPVTVRIGTSSADLPLRAELPALG
jgi:beta-glucosidase